MITMGYYCAVPHDSCGDLGRGCLLVTTAFNLESSPLHDRIQAYIHRPQSKHFGIWNSDKTQRHRTFHT